MVKYQQCLDAVHTDEEEHHTKCEEDDDEVVTTDEIMRVANAITEEEVEVKQDEVLAEVVVDDGKVSCDVCGKRYKVSDLKTQLFIK